MNFIIPYKHKTRTIKLLGENIVCSLILVLTIFFWICLRQGKQKQKKKTKWDYIKLKSFCTEKETIDKMKRLSTEWKKIFANNIYDKRLIIQHQLNIKKTNNPIKRWTEDMNRHFSKEDI